MTGVVRVDPEEHACATLPLFDEDGSILAALNVDFDEPHAFSDAELQLIDNLGRQCAEVMIVGRRVRDELAGANRYSRSASDSTYAYGRDVAGGQARCRTVFCDRGRRTGRRAGLACESGPTNPCYLAHDGGSSSIRNGLPAGATCVATSIAVSGPSLLTIIGSLPPSMNACPALYDFAWQFSS